MTYEEARALIQEHLYYGGSLDSHGLAVAMSAPSASIADTAGAKPVGSEWRALFNSTRSPETTFEQFCEWMREELAAPPAPSVADAAGASEPTRWQKAQALFGGGATGASEGQACHKCGLPMSVNPHPEAGKPPHYLEVGCPKECIPCLVKNRHGWATRAMKASGEIDALRERIAGMEKDSKCKCNASYPAHAEFCPERRPDERVRFEEWAKGKHLTRYIGQWMDRTADAYERTQLAEAALAAWLSRAALDKE